MMEIEKLIERLDDWEGCDAIYKGKFVEANCRIASRLLEEAAAALEQLQAENEKLKAQVPRWIPVEERLPEEKQRVIVRCERVGTSVGWILWGNWMTDIGPGAGKVTHWMPLPKAPKEGKKDD